MFHCRDLLPFGRLPVGSYRFVLTYSSYCVLVCVCTYLPNRLADKGPIIIVILSTVVLCKYNERTCALVVYCSSTGWRVHWGAGAIHKRIENFEKGTCMEGRREGRKAGGEGSLERSRLMGYIRFLLRLLYKAIDVQHTHHCTNHTKAAAAAATL